MSLIRALILDFDGVIVESNDVKTRAFEAVFARFPEHASAMVAYHHEHVSVTRFRKFEHLVVERLGRPAGDPLIGELANAFSAEALRRVVACPLVPGAQEFLARARGAVPIYLTSVTPQTELETILEQRGLTPYFTRVYGCPPWTKAGAIVDILAAFGGPRDILFIGDSGGDQRAALATGVEFIARDSGLPFDAPRPVAFPDLTRLGAAIAHRLPPAAKGPQ